MKAAMPGHTVSAHTSAPCFIGRNSHRIKLHSELADVLCSYGYKSVFTLCGICRPCSACVSVCDVFMSSLRPGSCRHQGSVMKSDGRPLGFMLSGQEHSGDTQE